MNNSSHKFFCLSKNLEYYFDKNNINLKEWQIFILFSIMGFNYYSIKSETEVLNGISGDSYYLLNNFLKCTDMSKVILTKSAQDYHKLRDNKIVLMMVDDFHIKHNVLCGKYHNKRFIVLENYNGETFDVFDSESRTMDIESINSSVDEVFYIDPNAFSDKYNEKMILDMMINSLKSTKFDYITNIERFANDLKNIEIPDNIKFNVYDNLYFYINRPAGPSIIRSQLGRGILKLSTLNKQGALQEIGDLLLDIGSRWELVGNLFFKLARVSNPKTFVNVCGKLDELISMENQFIKAISKISLVNF